MEDIGIAKDIECFRKGMPELSFFIYIHGYQSDLKTIYSKRPRVGTNPGIYTTGRCRHGMSIFMPCFFFSLENFHQTAELRSKHGLIWIVLFNWRRRTTLELLNQSLSSFFSLRQALWIFTWDWTTTGLLVSDIALDCVLMPFFHMQMDWFRSHRSRCLGVLHCYMSTVLSLAFASLFWFKDTKWYIDVYTAAISWVLTVQFLFILFLIRAVLTMQDYFDLHHKQDNL